MLSTFIITQKTLPLFLTSYLNLKIKLNFTIYSITILKKSLVKTVHEYLFTCMNFNQIDKTQDSVAKIANL